MQNVRYASPISRGGATRSPVGHTKRGKYSQSRSLATNVAPNVGTSSPNWSPQIGPIMLTVNVEVDPNRVSEFYKAIRINAEGSRKERGCLRMDVLQKKVSVDGKPQDADRLHFVFQEVWENQQAQDAHRETPHYKVWSEFRFGKKTEDGISIPPGVLRFSVEANSMLDI